MPLWHFENRTGELRYVPDIAGWDGVPMKPGEWMVSTGDGVGIAACIVACMKRLGLTNWLVFTDRCVLPLLHAKTGAAFGTDQWQNLENALRHIHRLAKLHTDPSTEISAIQMDGGKQNPFGPLIEWADRAIVTLYRGGDLATILDIHDRVETLARFTQAELRGGVADMTARREASSKLKELILAARQVQILRVGVDGGASSAGVLAELDLFNAYNRFRSLCMGIAVP